jgi:hypothetical protein
MSTLTLEPTVRITTGLAWRPVAIVAAGAFAVEMAASARYGYVRDELYFLAAGQHPAFGYVDQPALTPLLAHAWSVITFGSLAGFRVLGALALVALVFATASMAQVMGAGRGGQVLAALSAAVCTEFVAAAHELTTTTPDFVCWALTLLLVTRLLESRDPRWWMAIGAMAGVGAAAKWNIFFLLAGLALGFCLVPPVRRLAVSRYLVVGFALLALGAAPDLVWQGLHGWPNFDVFRALQGQARQNRLEYWPVQILYTGPLLVPVWVAGLRWSWRSVSWRPVAIACAFVIVIQFVLGGKSYYPGGAYSFLLAAGSVAISSRAGSVPRALVRRGAWLLVGGLVALPVVLPVLPARALHYVPVQKINYDLGEEIAWPREVALVARIYDGLPAAFRIRTTILTGNYGEAGALARYGPSVGLPTAYSGANNFWLWGPPPAGDVNAIVVNGSAAFLRREFRSVRQVAVFTNGLGVSDDEEGVPMYLCTGLRGSWAAVWPAFRNYS